MGLNGESWGKTLEPVTPVPRVGEGPFSQRDVESVPSVCGRERFAGRQV